MSCSFEYASTFKHAHSNTSYDYGTGGDVEIQLEESSSHSF